MMYKSQKKRKKWKILIAAAAIVILLFRFRLLPMPDNKLGHLLVLESKAAKPVVGAVNNSEIADADDKLKFTGILPEKTDASGHGYKRHKFTAGKNSICSSVKNVAATKISGLMPTDVSARLLPSACTLVVHIDGAVKNAGVYKLPCGGIVNDLVLAAGGLVQNADIKGLNLAEKLLPNAKLYVPSKGESKIPEKVVSQQVANVKGDNAIPVVAGKDNLDTNFDRDNVSEKIDIATANVEELQKVPGVGAKTAKAIVDFRRQHNFRTIEDIMHVPGIKKGKFAKIKDYIRVG